MNPEAGDTIAAIATSPGGAALGVIRVSGPAAGRILRAVAPRLRRDPEARRATVTRIEHDGALLDRAVVIRFPAPASFTGEDVVELQCHGGSVTLRRVLDAVLAAGARPAEPGEFSRRAFQNGRIDLVQLEAIADLISARSDAAHGVALEQLEGALSREIARAAAVVSSLLMRLEAHLEFGDSDDVPLPPMDEISRQVEAARSVVSRLLAGFDDGRLRRDGVRVAIIGPPNAGKSTLLNFLLGEDRSIVSEEPGTTRDWIEETLVVDGAAFRLVDTAGLRSASAPVEREGIARAERWIERADALLVIVAADEPADAVPLLARCLGKPSALVWNKADLASPPEIPGAPESAAISLRTGAGTDRLRLLLRELGCAAGLALGEEAGLLTRARHRDLLLRANEALERARDAFGAGDPPEFGASELRSALDALGAMTGAVTSEEILKRVMEGFCIGK